MQKNKRQSGGPKPPFFRFAPCWRYLAQYKRGIIAAQKRKAKTMSQEFELTTFDLDVTPGSDLPDIAVHNPITGNYMWLRHKNDFVDLFQIWSTDQMAECKMADPELLRAELWFNSEYSHLIQDQPGCLVGIHYDHLCAEIGAIERLEDLDIDQWCQSRETDQAIAKAIFELATVPSDAQLFWESPYSLEEKIVSRAFELTKEDQLQWGQETYKR